ncbi:MAG: isochorismatase family protein, partial [Thermodesulfobacteriota bacterium]
MSMTKRALIIVGMQMDYCRGGAIAVEEGDRIVPVINRYIDGFTEAGGSIYVVRDIHPEETPHFKGSGGKWPPHCVKGTPGAEFPSNLKLAPESIIITKGLDPVEECSSAFEGTDENGQTLADSLRARGINHLYITGLATDYSVRATALDA